MLIVKKPIISAFTFILAVLIFCHINIFLAIFLLLFLYLSATFYFLKDVLLVCWMPNVLYEVLQLLEVWYSTEQMLCETSPQGFK